MALLAAFAARAHSVDSLFTLQGPRGALAVHLQLPPHGSARRLPVVILCHGFAGHQNEPFISLIAEGLLREGMGVVRFDFNGHGESEGSLRQMDALNLQEDLRRVIAWTRRQPFTRGISLAGHSQGGVVVGMVAPELGRRVIKSVVLIASGGVAPDWMLSGNFFGARFDPWNLPEYIDLPNGLSVGRNYLATIRDLPIYQTARKYGGPTLVLNGTHDSVVPYNYAIRYAEVMPRAELLLIEGEDHGFTRTAHASAERIVRWLKRHH